MVKCKMANHAGFCLITNGCPACVITGATQAILPIIVRLLLLLMMISIPYLVSFFYIIIINNNNSLTIIGNMAWVAPVMTQAGQPFVIKQGLRYMRDIDWGAQMEEENQGKN